jgi:hypothetical protein
MSSQRDPSPVPVSDLAKRSATAALEMLAVYVDLYRRLQVWAISRGASADDDEFLTGTSGVALIASRRCGYAHQEIRSAGDIDAQDERRPLHELERLLGDLCGSLVQLTDVSRPEDLAEVRIADPRQLVERTVGQLGDWLATADVRVSTELMSLLTFLNADPA